VALALVAAAALVGCRARMHAPAVDPRRELDPSAQALAIADEYLARLFARDPEQATIIGWPAADHAAVRDPSVEAVQRWQAVEDGLLGRLRALDPPRLDRRARLSRGVILEALEASVALRVCRKELWDVSSTFGWQAQYATRLAEAQPVGTPELRVKAVERIRRLALSMDARIASLREGVRLGYAASRENVERVRRELDALLAARPADAPFMRPAVRADDAAFRTELERVVAGELFPAVRRYRDFLAGEYAAKARTAPGVSALPDGAACYRAAVREASTLDVPAERIHETGLREMALIQGEMERLAEHAFGTRDVPGLLARLRSDPAYRFRSPEEILAAANAAIARARTAMPRWFGRLPKAPVRVQPFPDFLRETSPADRYSWPSPGSGGEGIYFVNAFVPPSRSRAGLESTTFHEAIPGHHLQLALALEAGEVPVTRYLWNSGFAEGWALYAERLADEMGLFGSDLDRMGLLSAEAARAARLVVDSGIHVLGWSRQRAIDYLLEHTAVRPELAESEVDRYASNAGQATSYMLGALEIRGLRREAERALGPRFDVRAFHDAVLCQGTIPLPTLREVLERWIEAQRASVPGASVDRVGSPRKPLCNQ